MADEKVTAETLESWLTVREARDRAAARVGDNSALQAVWALIRNGMIATYAGRSASRLGEHGTPTPKLEPSLIAAADWAQYNHGIPHDFWRGQVMFHFRHGHGYGNDRYVTCFDIRLDPDAVDREFPRPKGAPSTLMHQGFAAIDPDRDVPSSRNLGGAPKKEFWDDMWIAIFGLIWDGKLTPENQAQIETAMLDWAERHGHKLGETTVKKPAQKLFKAYKSWV